MSAGIFGSVDRSLPKIVVSAELHAVTGITGGPNDVVIELLDLPGHSWKTSWARPSDNVGRSSAVKPQAREEQGVHRDVGHGTARVGGGSDSLASQTTSRPGPGHLIHTYARYVRLARFSFIVLFR